MEKIPRYFGYGLFFLLLFIPTSYQIAKGVILLFVLFGCSVGILSTGRVQLHKAVCFFALLSLVAGLFFLLNGIVRGAPGALNMSTVHVLWPLVYLILISFVTTESHFRQLSKFLVAAVLAVVIYSFSFILHEVGWLPDLLYVPFEQGQAIEFYKGYVEFNLYSMASLIFGVPFVIGALITWPNGDRSPIRRIWLWIAAGLGFTLVLLSGRRALVIVLLLSPVITFSLRGLGRRFPEKGISFLAASRITLALGLLFVGAFFCLKSVAQLDLSALSHSLMEGFDFSSDLNANPRKEQFFALLSGWLESPWLGNGLGSNTWLSVREPSMPWAYELYYVALLFQTGCVGLIVYGTCVLWIYSSSLRILRSSSWQRTYALPVLVGTTCFLIANATNPYLAKFDFMWVIFLPIALVNSWLLERSTS